MLYRDDGRVLMLEDVENSGCLDLPGGRLEHAEFQDPWSLALKRELAEEVGKELKVELEEKPIFMGPHRIMHDGKDALLILYRGRWQGGEVKLDGKEHSRFFWEDPYCPPSQMSWTGALKRYFTHDEAESFRGLVL